MGYPDGYYYGQGRIICDTSTFSVGDTIRVRSMTDSSKVWNQQVATVGTALVFTVPCYDYYKICTVQDIGGVLTEIGGVYKTVDYGQTIFIDVLDQRSLVAAKRIVNAHQHNAIYSVGDEVDVTIGGVKVTFQDAGHDLYASNEILYVAKDIYQNITLHTNQTSSPMPYRDVTGRTTIKGIYDNIAENDKQCISPLYKTSRPAYNGTSPASFVPFEDYIWIPNYIELFGVQTLYQDSNSPKYQFPLFTTQANRVKKYNGTEAIWWTCEGYADQYGARRFWGVIANGTGDVGTPLNAYGIVPCFHIVADS